MRIRRFELGVLACLVVVVVARGAGAQEDETAQARAAFVEGTTFSRNAQWSEALVAFERSAKLKPHAVTTYNIGACERALGRYTRARVTLLHSLDENRKAGDTQLPADAIADMRGWLDQIERNVAVATLTVTPESASITVDGRPLAKEGATWVSGLRDAGPGEPAPSGQFDLVLDPGFHVITLSRKGYTDVVVRRTFAPGSRESVPLALDRLPATLHIASQERDAVVLVGGSDVGLVPVDLSRPPGSYKVVVRKPGFVAYETQVALSPGEELTLRATLSPEKRSLLVRWWFWTAVGVVIAGAVIGTYAIVQSQQTPTPIPLDCGGLSWCASGR